MENLAMAYPKKEAFFTGSVEGNTAHEARSFKPELDAPSTSRFFLLCDGLDDVATSSLLVHFSRDLKRNISLVRTALAENALEDLKHAAHALKGLAGFLGAQELEWRAKVVQEACLASKGNLPRFHADQMLGYSITLLAELIVFRETAEFEGE